MKILEMFDEIEIKNDTRVSKEDLEKIQELQNDFDIDKEFHFKMKNLIENEFKGEIELFGKSAYTKRKLMESNYSAFMDRAEHFKSDIYYYFNKKYNCTLKSNYKAREENKFDAYNECRTLESNEKLKYYEELNYNQILDDIFEQLGGLTLENKQEDEVIKFLKDKTKQYREDNKKVVIKGKKITINAFFGIDDFDAKWGTTRISYYYRDNFSKLFESFDIFDNKNNSKETFNNFVNLEGESLITTHELDYDDIQALKLFKNGRIDITFSSNLKALKYTKKFLSYEE